MLCRAWTPSDVRFIRVMLVRVGGYSEEIPVSRICAKHVERLSPRRGVLHQHVLQAACISELGRLVRFGNVLLIHKCCRSLHTRWWREAQCVLPIGGTKSTQHEVEPQQLLQRWVSLRQGGGVTNRCLSWFNFRCDTHGGILLAPRFRQLAMIVTLESLSESKILARRMIPVSHS